MDAAPLQAALEVCNVRLDMGSVAPVAVAFSGGGDSLAVLLAARIWAKRYGRPLLALHVDHRLQPASGAVARQAAQAAQRLGVDFRGLVWDGDKPTAGRPAAARAARHRLIADAARAAGAQVILMGHTLDDQLENALMRGAGVPVGALGAWSPSPAWPQGRGLFLCRPLLTARRAALRDWLAAEGLSWIDDPANDDPRHPRTRARRALADGAASAPLLPAADLGDLTEAVRVSPWGAIELDRRALQAAPEPQARRLLQIALACASGGSGALKANALLSRLRGAQDFTAGLAGARILAGQAVRLTREAGEAARGGLAPIELEPGQDAVWDGRWAVRANEAGVRVEALSGLAARLSAGDAALLRGVPASDRPSLPVLRDATGSIRLAKTRSSDNMMDGVVDVHGLVQPRVRAACGLIVREDQIGRTPAWRDPIIRPMLGRKLRADG
jgi:tRNA(Ile)-lysidine synthase